MHITLEADYAIRIVYSLACSGRRTDAKTLSQQTGVTLRFALKILRKLVAAGLVRSFKGTQGGYEIARPLTEITLRGVIEAVQGPYALSRCVDPSGEFQCSNPETGACCFHRIFADISAVVNSRLEAVRFSDLPLGKKKNSTET